MQYSEKKRLSMNLEFEGASGMSRVQSLNANANASGGSLSMNLKLKVERSMLNVESFGLTQGASVSMSL